MTAIIIIFLCWLLYKAGAASLLLDCFRLPEEATTAQETHPAPVTGPPELSPYQQHLKDRQQWENDARYILTKQGYKNPDTVQYMGDEMLIKIIRDYLDI